MRKTALASMSIAGLVTACAFVVVDRTQAAPFFTNTMRGHISLALANAQQISEQRGDDYGRGYGRDDEDYSYRFRHRHHGYGYDHERGGRERGYDRNEDRDYRRGYRGGGYGDERGDDYDRDYRGDDRRYDRDRGRDYRRGDDDFDFDSEPENYS